jgi:hypothetical protein
VYIGHGAKIQLSESGFSGLKANTGLAFNRLLILQSAFNPDSDKGCFGLRIKAIPITIRTKDREERQRPFTFTFFPSVHKKPLHPVRMEGFIKIMLFIIWYSSFQNPGSLTGQFVFA